MVRRSNHGLALLRIRARQLNLVGLWIALNGAFSIMLVLLFVAWQAMPTTARVQINTNSIQILLVFAAGGAIILAALFEYLRKSGDVAFDEANEDLQELVSISGLSRRARGEDEREVARVLRTYARSVDVPLVPGRAGLMVYVLVCLADAVFVSYIAPAFLQR